MTARLDAEAEIGANTPRVAAIGNTSTIKVLVVAAYKAVSA